MQVRDHVLVELADDRHDGTILGVVHVVTNVEANNATDADAAQLDGRPEIEAVNGFVEIDDEPFGFVEKRNAAEREQRDRTERKRANHESADYRWADFCFHEVFAAQKPGTP